MNYNRVKLPDGRYVDQSLSRWAIWKHNWYQVEETEKLIKCSNCKCIQHKANWHYLKCINCDAYLWDDRWL